MARCPCSCGFFTSQWVNLLLILFFSYRNVYNCSERPRHMAVAIDTYNYVIIHPVSNIIKEYNINNYSSFNSRLIVYYYSLHSFTLAEWPCWIPVTCCRSMALVTSTGAGEGRMMTCSEELCKYHLATIMFYSLKTYLLLTGFNVKKKN